MKIINHKGETFEHIYNPHDRWYEDLDDFIVHFFVAIPVGESILETTLPIITNY